MRVPALMVVGPVLALAALSAQVPTPVLASAVVFTELLSTTAPPKVFAAVLVPVSVSVLLPAPLAVRALVNVRAPLPYASIVAPPVVPAWSITRSLLWPEPVYCRVAPVVVEPIVIVPLAAVVGAPSALDPPPTFASELILRVPAPKVVM